MFWRSQEELRIAKASSASSEVLSLPSLAVVPLSLPCDASHCLHVCCTCLCLSLVFSAQRREADLRKARGELKAQSKRVLELEQREEELDRRVEELTQEREKTQRARQADAKKVRFFSFGVSQRAKERN